ncbi:branched-chain amino acid ABC transporter substrate-binding protein [Blastococcus capsensis]|uniref:branched-chain amino acid ABC transporter substrate-binding protein n=1 Tax=Blastococcus capsensis TaxID=1564163 RepID=UPI002541A253|nr:branched-chain amino acid ABC transporter substrate-binding protein [Blastococcus capsensis]MDK3258262.1 branched-chain amino acid ABC transporter substrate-binding protein [Blastococcus capsensis]
MTPMTGRPRRRSATFASVFAASLVLTGCGGGLLSGDDEAAGSDEPIALGMITPLSGSSAAIGPYMQNGAQLAVDEINADGGIDGRELELVIEDGACDPRTATAAANKLVTEGVEISVGGYCSGATLPTLPIFNKAGVPMIIPAANSTELVDQGLENVFLINGTGTQQAQAAVEFMEKQGATRVAIVDDNTSYSTDIAEQTAELLEGGEGPELVLQESVTAGESDYSANVNAVVQANPDFVYWTGYYQEGGLIIRQLRQAGYTGPIMVADGSVDQQLVEIAGAENAAGVFATMTQTPDTIPGAEDWIASYTEKFGADPGPYSTQAYDAVRVAAEALREAGSTETDEVIAALEAIDGFELFSGPLQFTEDHTLSSGGFLILSVQDGEFQLEDPLE